MRLLQYFGILFLVGVILFGGWLFYQEYREPLTALQNAIVRVTGVKQIELNRGKLPDNRYYSHVSLMSEEGSDIVFYISRPKTASVRKLPVIFVLGGWKVGLQTFDLIADPGEYILVIYRYGYTSEEWKSAGNKPAEVFRIRRAILAVPDRVVQALLWIATQNDVDKEAISLMGVSLGALFTPAIYHLADREGVALADGVIAFGGADLESLLVQNVLKNAIGAKVLAMMLHPLEPALHIPYVHQEILFINGTHDDKIPMESARRLHRLKPPPKKIVWLDTAHIQPNREEIVREVVEITTNWLELKGILKH